jgi:ArsR family transcriptional regulator, arsenate/arsenite/antimonite-responsive transcriptional repressor / arsenate reductase (thioredoxin)
MNVESSELTSRANVYAALGEPTRLAIADALSLGDASPGELARAMGLPTNLLAHHVNVLEQAGVLVRRRSEGDRRRTYLHLVPAVLTGLIPVPLREARRVVFVCTHNSARSQLAAAMWTQHNPVPAASAGTQPAAQVHPRAVRIARRHGLDLRDAHTHHLDQVLDDEDLVVAVCDNAYEQLSAGPAPDLHWSVPDPAPVDTDSAFEAAYTDLAGRVDRLAAAVTSRS